MAEFNTTNECGITVEAQENQGGYNDIRDKMNAGIATGELPGLVVGYQNDQAFYALGGGLADINPYMNDAYWGLTAEEQADFYASSSNNLFIPPSKACALGFPQPLYRNHVLQPDLARGTGFCWTPFYSG